MPEEPLFQRIDCLALPVDDVEAAVGFYRGLGHELIWRTPTAAGLRLQNCGAELVVQSERPRAETDLAVEAVGPAVARFVAAGGRVVVEPFEIQIGQCAVVADPWGNHLVILDSSKGRLVTDESGNVTGNER